MAEERQYRNQRQDQTFAESPGIPVREHQKKLAKEKKEVKKSKTFYTYSGDKILIVTAKRNGAYSSYFGKKSKIEKRLLDKKIADWKTKGQWLEPHEVKPRLSEEVAKLAKE